MIRKVAFLTAGGYAPCLSSAIAALVEEYERVAPNVEIIGYRHGYEGLLQGDSIVFTPEARANIARLYAFGGSPIGNSRVKLTNTADLIRRGLVPEDTNPLQVAADQLAKDGVDVLHTIGGDDTNTTAADLAAYLASNSYPLTVVGLPKTIDNDIVPIRQSLGAWTAADQGARFAANVIAEHNANSRVLIVHEIMGRNCGYLAAETTRRYRAWLDAQQWLPEVGLTRETWEAHALYVPEVPVDIAVEATRLKAVMDRIGCVNVFISEGAGVPEIVAELEKAGADIPRDAFGHVKLDKINPGEWFANQFAALLDARKVLVFKSGYFSRSAASNDEDLALIRATAGLAVKSALEGRAGVVGMDEEAGDELTTIAFTRIAGHKPFDATLGWYRELLQDIGQG
ncbi:MAG: pyrophosphate--fructose-6-phosphate 1-phosphotransferase [Propionibacteriaceae bacterium]|jgi:pyrophosphate--fructose-6-phosphate 1-phosphotransferase|nr:pyrophosphate--fructose-6-phosphate 1-phosphotransferase [Propionibacteriaceae bacterium]